MKLLILGATGGTGRQLVPQALALGHALTVLVRDPIKLGVDRERMRVYTGSLPEAAERLRDAVQGQDAVVSCLGVGNATRSGGLIGSSLPLVVDAMRSAGVRRLVHVSAFGVGATQADVPLLPRLAQRLFLANVFADKAAGERCLDASGLEWTVICPSVLTDGRRTGQWRAAEHLPLAGVPRISRGDLADFTLGQLQDRQFVGKRVLVSH